MAQRNLGCDAVNWFAVPNVVDLIEAETKRKKVPELRPGDTVRVHAKVVEGTRERVQMFEGIVIGIHGSGVKEVFTVRRIAHGVGVERSFLVHSPRIDKIDVLRHGDVRQGRLYYLRGKVGREARIRERRRLVGEAEADSAVEEPDAVAEGVAEEPEKQEA